MAVFQKLSFTDDKRKQGKAEILKALCCKKEIKNKKKKRRKYSLEGYATRWVRTPCRLHKQKSQVQPRIKI